MLRNRMMRGAGYTRPQSPLLLDIYSGAAAVYSLRKLRNGYSGSAIRVRRSSDSAEMGFGFLDGVLDTASMLSWVNALGSADGFVTTWYDQSGNGRHVSQSSANSQPFIVTSGALITSGGLPGVHFATSGARWFNSVAVAFSDPSSFTLFCAASTSSSNAYRGLFSTSASAGGVVMFSHLGGGFTLWGTYAGGDYASSADFNGRGLLEMISSDGNSGSFYIDSVSAGTFANTAGHTGFYLGGYAPASQNHNGVIQEIIYYESNQSVNRATIATAMNTFYGIY